MTRKLLRKENALLKSIQLPSLLQQKETQRLVTAEETIPSEMKGLNVTI